MSDETTTQPDTDAHGDESCPDSERPDAACCGVPGPGETPVVTIYGAGIGGLSAAHELIERGFVVQVVEPAESLFEEGCCEVGGIAATQWGFLPDTDLPFGPSAEALASGAAPATCAANTGCPPRERGFLDLGRAVGLPWRLYFDGTALASGAPVPSSGTLDPSFVLSSRLRSAPAEPAALENMANAGRMQLLLQRLEEMKQRFACFRPLTVYVVGHTERSADEATSRAWSSRWAEDVRDALEAVHPASNGDFVFVTAGMGSADPEGDDAFQEGRARNNRVELRVSGVHLPGDHGYRFFPRFYRNLDDTMSRTPLYDEEGRETGQSALSRLLGTGRMGIALDDGRPTLEVPRRRANSWEELRRLSTQMLERLDYEPRDLALFQLQMFRFVTMCPKRRRKELGGVSWFGYLTGRERRGKPETCEHCCRPRHAHGCLPFSDQFLKDLDKLPQAMAGMRAKESDACTNGVVSLQLLLDQMSDGSGVDRLLDGPTSRAWLQHWKRYLQRQGVRFFVGRLDRFEAKTCGTCDPPCVELEPVAVGLRNGQPIPDEDAPEGCRPPLLEPGYDDQVSEGHLLGPTRRTAPDAQPVYERPAFLAADFHVAAMPVHVLKRILEGSSALPAEIESPLAKIRDFPVGNAFDVRSGPVHAAVPFRDISGVQFYFRSDLSFSRGHVYHRDSPWRLTSVSQPQFWRERRTTNSRYLGLLSVDIGEMHAPDPSEAQWTALELGELEAELEAEIQELVRRGHPSATDLHALLQPVRDARAAGMALRGKVEEFVDHLNGKTSRDCGTEALGTTTGQGRPWEKVAELRLAIEQRLATPSPRGDTVTAALAKLLGNLAGAPPTSSGKSALKRAVAEAATAPPAIEKIEAEWRTVLRCLARIADVLDAPAVQASWARRALTLVRDMLLSPGRIAFAWQCTREELARRVWTQIKLSSDLHIRGTLPDPLYFHIDASLEFGRAGGLPSRNGATYLINDLESDTDPTRGFSSRPGVLPGDGKLFQDIAHGRWLVVGGAMKSYTRITSMEHANETARHAVRALLHRLVTCSGSSCRTKYRGQGQRYGDLPRFWNPEDHELDDLGFLRRVDEILFEEGIPHMADILGLEEVVARASATAEGSMPVEFGALLSAMGRQAERDNRPWLEAMEKMADPLRRTIEVLTAAGMKG